MFLSFTKITWPYVCFKMILEHIFVPLAEHELQSITNVAIANKMFIAVDIKVAFDIAQTLFFVN